MSCPSQPPCAQEFTTNATAGSGQLHTVVGRRSHVYRNLGLSRMLVWVAALDQLVRGQRGVERLAGALNTHHRQSRGIEQADLHQNGRLVPVNVLVGQFALPEA